MRLILAGLGSMGLNWASVLAHHPDVEMVGFVEPDLDRRARFTLEGGTPADRLFARLEDALYETRAEGLVDVTPPAAHPLVSSAALEAGLHVITEKPLADTMERARELATLAQQQGRVHMVAQNYRFQPAARTLRRLIAEGLIGRVGGVALRFAVGARWDAADFRVKMDQPLLLDMSIHHMDLLRACLGGDAQRVYAQTWNPPGSWYAGDAGVAATFTFDEHLVVGYHGSWSAVGDQTSWNGEWHIEGETGGLIWDADGLWLAHGAWTRGTREALPIDQQSTTGQPFSGQRAVLDEFLAAVREGRTPECSSADNLLSLGMVFAAAQSARTGQVVPLQ